MTNAGIEKRQASNVDIPERMEQGSYFTPLVDILEDGDAFIFQADLPGVKAGDVDIRYENGTLSIEGKVQPREGEGRSYVLQEYGVGHFYRQFALRAPINPDGIRAELKNGVLELYVPKAESVRTRRIQIKTS